MPVVSSKFSLFEKPLLYTTFRRVSSFLPSRERRWEETPQFLCTTLANGMRKMEIGRTLREAVARNSLPLLLHDLRLRVRRRRDVHLDFLCTAHRSR